MVKSVILMQIKIIENLMYIFWLLGKGKLKKKRVSAVELSCNLLTYANEFM